MTRADLVGTVLDGKLRIERLVASGAGGDVFEATHLGLGSRVAVKVLRQGGGDIADVRRKRFQREARVAARLRSPHAVRIFDIAGDGETLYLVMELLDGETLADRLAREGALKVSDAVRWLGQGADALGEMHEAGIIHRDVKPSNLFLAREADGERVKLLDFGIAGLRQPTEDEDSTITMTAAFVGTPKYMAPEQARSSKGVDARADVWALGVTLYELLTGVPPFDGQTVVAILYQIENESPKPLRERRADVPAGLAALVHRCLTREPEQRPADARAFARELAAFDLDAAHGRSRPRFSPRAAFAVSAMAAAVVATVVGLRRPSEARPLVAASPPPDPTPVLAPSKPAAGEPSPPITEVPVSMLPQAPPDSPSAARPASMRAPPIPDSASRVRPRPAPPRPATPRSVAKDDDRIE